MYKSQDVGGGQLVAQFLLHAGDQLIGRRIADILLDVYKRQGVGGAIVPPVLWDGIQCLDTAGVLILVVPLLQLLEEGFGVLLGVRNIAVSYTHLDVYKRQTLTLWNTPCFTRLYAVGRLIPRMS